MSIRWTTAFLDLPPATHAVGTRFWQTVTAGTPSAPRGDAGQFATLLPADGEAFLRVQRLDEGPRVHLDLHVDDLAAEVSRAVGLGATGDGADGTAGGPTTGAVLEPLTRPAGMPLRLLLHRLGTDDPGTRVRAHLDLAAGPHRERVVAEHVDAGARVLRRHERWTVLVDPAGLPYCVTDRSPVTGLLPSVADRDELAR
jgi:hypothetical protein